MNIDNDADKEKETEEPKDTNDEKDEDKDTKGKENTDDINEIEDSDEDKNYTDAYFESGHILLKIWQTIILILAWICFFAPIVITGATYIAYLTNGKHGHYFWRYSEGFDMINMTIILLVFALAMIAVFCISISYVQYRRAEGLVTKWPMYDIAENKAKRLRAEVFMTKRFGPAAMRRNVRYYEVQPDQNLDKSTLKDVIEGKEDDKD